ncbi:hypothetical protein LAV73_19755 [Lysinibacillus xylanilyticus]|uniref:hypothetical protein n=1 Tax=Lysinibacillus xylanilyticus TaxID=582475 RepID=UPI002B2510B6|nr:hypothetical protein [Lysinibacillus xylanilyticus]MEB2282190.1 hypothetical protein [Lysinibacillus xylanilyticus]
MINPTAAYLLVVGALIPVTALIQQCLLGDELFFDCMTTYSKRLLKKDSFKFIQNSKTIDIPHNLLAEFHVAQWLL